MLTLRTFGAVYVFNDSDVPLAGAATQRRLLALLALVAAGGSAGVSRDRVLSLLWPEADEERARGALAQSLYHARKTFGAEDLFASGADLRLNRACLEADVLLFEDAFTAKDMEGAARMYRGPFLDGFLLPGASEFERWVSSRRSVYARQAATAFSSLAQRAEQANDYRNAVEWRRRAVAIDPFESEPTVRLMSALAASGDRAAALQQARVHETLLREQLDAPADPAVARLVRSLRESFASSDARSAPVEPVPVRAAVSPTPESVTRDADAAALPEPIPVAHRSPATSRDGQGRRRLVLFGGSLLAIVLAAIGIGLSRHTSTVTAGVIRGQSLVVAPFRTGAADPALAYLREGMVELLTLRLGADSAVHSIDPGAVLNAWRRGAVASPDADRETAIRTARALGAQQVVVGSVVGIPARLIVTASLLTVADGQVAASVTVEGSADSLTALVDRVAIELIASEAGESDRLGRRTTLSLPALRAYLAGQAAYRRDDYSAAAVQYERAVGLDSTFALAALQLSLAADRLNDAEQHDRALALAWDARDDLTERDRSYLIAFAGPRYPSPSPEAEQLVAWERAIALSPDRADSWYELGERYFHEGDVVGVPNASARAAAALRRALTLAPGHAAARRLLILLAARDGDTTALARLATPAALADSVGDLSPFVRWRVAVARGDAAGRRAVLATFPHLDAANLRMIAMASQFDATSLPDGERALRVLRQGRTLRAAELLDVFLAEHSLALNEGEPIRALDLTEQLQELQLGTRAHLRLRVLDAIYADGDRAAAEAAAAELARQVDAPGKSGATDAGWLADVCVVGQWRLASGNAQGIDRLVRELRSGGVPRVLVPVSANPLTCAALLEATAAVVGRRADAFARVESVDALMLSGPAVGDASNYAHLVVARLYLQLGKRDAALAAIRRRPYMAGWPRYMRSTRIMEERLLPAREPAGSGPAM